MSTATDPGVVVDVNLDLDVPCIRCDHVATSRARCRTCPHVGTICDQCVDYFLSVPFVTCAQCRECDTFPHQFRVTPL